MSSSLAEAIRGCQNRQAVISEGKQIALRRERAGWIQDELADAAGVSRSSVWKIENDKNVQVDILRAVETALAAREHEQGLSPTLSGPDAIKGDAVLARLKEARHDLGHIHTFLKGALDTVESTLKDLDDLADDHTLPRKRA